MVAGSTSETETIESHRFSLLVDGAMACHGPVRISDMRILRSPPTPAPNGPLLADSVEKVFFG
jgi:hypothetical protein